MGKRNPETEITLEGIKASVRRNKQRVRRTSPQRQQKAPRLPKALAAHDARVPMRVLCDPRMSVSARLAFAIMCGLAWGQKDVVYPAQTTMATWLGLQPRQVQRLVNELVAKHKVGKEPRQVFRGTLKGAVGGLQYRLLHKRRPA